MSKKFVVQFSRARWNSLIAPDHDWCIIVWHSGLRHWTHWNVNLFFSPKHPEDMFFTLFRAQTHHRDETTKSGRAQVHAVARHVSDSCIRNCGKRPRVLRSHTKRRVLTCHYQSHGTAQIVWCWKTFRLASVPKSLAMRGKHGYPSVDSISLAVMKRFLPRSLGQRLIKWHVFWYYGRRSLYMISRSIMNYDKLSNQRWEFVVKVHRAPSADSVRCRSSGFWLKS